ncbi:MAG: hypothetical protein ACR2OC_09855 [Solirubrobacterales bacterium]
MATVTGIGSSPELAFLTQLFVLGSAVRMVVALVRHRQTGRVDEWPVYVARWALLALMLAGIILVLDAVISSR